MSKNSQQNSFVVFLESIESTGLVSAALLIIICSVACNEWFSKSSTLWGKNREN